ncbi:tetratricopeptide repeat-containing glycosyltransferase family 2 protein [Paenibacillus protaetiae]|uniref:Glycosyltransferase n=1 Tax=Paenibacillus protaetiae TaxID=2509456 RepID=A0A4P6ESK0_9BACL|nr:glycosyltransferase [Paenibacillus protaetiae]QAY65546.1 glycosyltransferase [Paenibacillus protaetiae]
MVSISLCMIVKNEEGTLGRILSAMKDIADEIIIVDTGSTDRTKQIAYSFRAKVYDFEWINDFAAARNYSFSKATKQYIMWLDADDIIEKKDQLLLKRLKQHLDPVIDRVTMAYHLGFDQKGNVTYSLRRNRIVKRERNFQWIGPVHEYLHCYGTVYHAEAAVTHSKQKEYTDRNLRIYLERLAAGEHFTPRDQYYFANELRTHERYSEAVEWYTKFLDGKQGWIEDNILASLRLAECYRRLKDEDKRFQALTRALKYDKPRPELCCDIGAYFLELGQYRTAAYWYEQALKAEEPEGQMAMINLANSTWIPHIQLCLCYDRLGDYEKAYEHNEKAREYNPTHPSVVYNTNYFKERHGK